MDNFVLPHYTFNVRVMSSPACIFSPSSLSRLFSDLKRILVLILVAVGIPFKFVKLGLTVTPGLSEFRANLN
jgi:hypothetical protein